MSFSTLFGSGFTENNYLSYLTPPRYKGNIQKHTAPDMMAFEGKNS